MAFEFAALRIWQRRHDKPGPQGWLVIRRSLDPTPEIKYYISNAPEATPLEVLAQVACNRFRVEEFFEDAKTSPFNTPPGALSWEQVKDYVSPHHRGKDASTIMYSRQCPRPR